MNLNILIVCAEFNKPISEALLQGAEEYFASEGLAPTQLHKIWVPGAFEIPTVAAKAAQSGKFSAILCLGAVIKGESAHFDYICASASQEIAKIGPSTGVPVIFGVLTALNSQQALERCGVKGPNHGPELAAATLKMIRCMDQLEKI